MAKKGTRQRDSEVCRVSLSATDAENVGETDRQSQRWKWNPPGSLVSMQLLLSSRACSV